MSARRPQTIFAALLILFSVTAIFFDYYDRRFLWLFKPLPLILIMTMVGFYSMRRGFYRNAIIGGLFFSLIGDVFLIDPLNFFIYGLAAFFVAHLFYISAFFRTRLTLLSALAFIPGFLLFVTIYHGVPDIIKAPVFFYALAISTMLFFALNLWLIVRSRSTLFAAIGAVLFVISDSIIAINRFSYEFYLSKLFVLTTYFIAQWLIARSIDADQDDFR